MKINGLSKVLTTAALGVSLAAAASTAPSAAPLPVLAANVVAEAPSTAVDQVHWRGRGYGYRRGFHAGPFLAGAAFGGLLGAASFGGFGYGYGYPYYGGYSYYPAYSYGYGYPYHYGYARPIYRKRYYHARRYYRPRVVYHHRPGFYRAAYWGPRHHYRRHWRQW